MRHWLTRLFCGCIQSRKNDSAPLLEEHNDTPTLLSETSNSQTLLRQGQGGKFAVEKHCKGAEYSDAARLHEAKRSIYINLQSDEDPSVSQYKKHIVQLVNSTRPSPFAPFSLEHISGQTLANWIASHQQTNRMIPFNQAIDITLQVISALSYCHSNGVVHGNINPDHVMLSPGNQITLIGFAPHDNNEPTYRDWAMNETLHAMIPTSDLYQTTVLLLELLTSQLDSAFRNREYINHLHQLSTKNRLKAIKEVIHVNITEDARADQLKKRFARWLGHRPEFRYLAAYEPTLPNAQARAAQTEMAELLTLRPLEKEAIDQRAGIGEGHYGRVHQIKLNAAYPARTGAERVHRIAIKQTKATDIETWHKHTRELLNEKKIINTLHQTASRTQAAHIVTLIPGILSSIDKLFMAYIPGVTLEHWIAQSLTHKSLDGKALLKLCRDVLIGLHHAHTCGYAHADIKPENVIVSNHDGKTTHAVIIDWGLAHLIHDPQNSKKRGSPCYIDPLAFMAERNTQFATASYDTHAVFLILAFALHRAFDLTKYFHCPSATRQTSRLQFFRELRGLALSPSLFHLQTNSTLETLSNTWKATSPSPISGIPIAAIPTLIGLMSRYLGPEFSRPQTPDDQRYTATAINDLDTLTSINRPAC